MSRSGNPAKQSWRPMQRGTPANPQYDHEAWGNRLYQATVRYHADGEGELGRDGFCELSIKRNDRAAIRDWRHLQQIKNEVLGPEREAVELFPAESRLVDLANQYWLWVFPAGIEFPIGFRDGAVATDEQAEEFSTSGHKGRQRVWEPGLTTGRNDSSRVKEDDELEQEDAAFRRRTGTGPPTPDPKARKR